MVNETRKIKTVLVNRKTGRDRANLGETITPEVGRANGVLEVAIDFRLEHFNDWILLVGKASYQTKIRRRKKCWEIVGPMSSMETGIFRIHRLYSGLKEEEKKARI